MSVNLFAIDPDEFYAHLLAQPLSSVVGMACDDGDCPLARFLNAQYEGSTFFVNKAEYRRCGDDISLGPDCDDVCPLPAWAQAFADLIDEASSYLDDMPVTAHDALLFLHAACGLHDVLLLEVQHG